MNLEKRIDDLISKMTLEEKIGQLQQISSIRQGWIQRYQDVIVH